MKLDVLDDTRVFAVEANEHIVLEVVRVHHFRNLSKHGLIRVSFLDVVENVIFVNVVVMPLEQRQCFCLRLPSPLKPVREILDCV